MDRINAVPTMAETWQKLGFSDGKPCTDSRSAIEAINICVSKNTKKLPEHVHKLLVILPASTLAQLSPGTSSNIHIVLSVLNLHFEKMMASDQLQNLLHDCFRRITFGILLLMKTQASTICIQWFFYIVFTPCEVF